MADAFALKIAPADAAAAALFPALVAFRVQAVGTPSSPLPVTVIDMGSAALTVSNATATGAFSLQNNCATVAAAGGTCTIQVTFTPTASGTQTGALTITDSSAGSPRTVQLTGQGGQGSVAFAPSSLSFSSQQLGATSSPQVITLTNTGVLALQISRIQASSPFDETNNCGTSVAANASCTISVTFTPTASGAATGTVTFTDSAPDSPQTVSLTGTGTATGSGSVTVSPSGLSFSNQQVGTTSSAQTVTLMNSTTSALQITSIQTATPFGQTNTCGASVASNSSCTVSVTFAPTAAGSAPGTLVITDAAPNSPQTVTLSGTGSSSAPAIGLGVASGGSASATVTAGTSAAYALAIGGAGMGGTAALTCSGAPTGAACSVPASVSLSATTASSFNVSVSTTARSLVLFTPVRPTPWLLLLALLALALLLTTASAQHSRRWRLAPLMAFVLCACGGGSTSMQTPNGTSAGTYTLVVTAKSGGTTQTQNLTLTVN